MSEYVQIYDNATGVPKVKCLRDVNATPAANPVRYAGIAVPRTSLTEEVLQTKNTIHVSTFFYSGPGNPLVSVVKQGFSNAKLLGVIPNDPLHYVTPSEVADAVKVAIATNYDPATKQISFVDAAGNVIPVFAGGLEHNTAGASGGASSGAGTTASPMTIRIATNSVTGIAYATRATNIPTDMNRDDSDISPAAVKKMLQYIKPVASASGLNAEQISPSAIEVPMFDNFSCTGGTGGAPKWRMHLAGGGSCDIDLGAYGGGETIPSGTVVASGVTGCFRLPDKGLYRISWDGSPSDFMYLYNIGYSAARPSPCMIVKSSSYVTSNGDAVHGQTGANSAGGLGPNSNSLVLSYNVSISASTGGAGAGIDASGAFVPGPSSPAPVTITKV